MVTSSGPHFEALPEGALGPRAPQMPDANGDGLNGTNARMRQVFDGTYEEQRETTTDKLASLRMSMQTGETLVGWDTHCDCPKKGLLLSREGVANIERIVPGPRRYFFMDIGHMSVPNRFRLEKLVDMFVEQIAELARTHVVPAHGMFVRLGGDEFAFIVHDTPAANAAMERFSQGLAEASAKLFDPDRLDPTVLEVLNRARTAKGEQAITLPELRQVLRDARHFAAVRQQMRGPVRGEYNVYLARCKQSKMKPSMSYAQFVRTRLAKRKIDVHAMSDEDAIVRYAEDQIARTGKEDPQLCLPDIVSLALPDALQPADFSAAMNTCDKNVHRRKVGKPPLSPDVRVPETENQEKERERFQAQQDTFRDLHARLRTLEADGKKSSKEWKKVKKQINDLLYKDATTGAVVRERLDGENEDGEKVYTVHEGQTWHVLHCDVSQFGVINNQGGYELADEALGIFAEGIMALEPTAILVRGRGGAVHILSEQAIPARRVEHLAKAFSLSIIEMLKDFEYRSMTDETFERNALEHLLARTRHGKKPEYKHVGVVDILHTSVTVRSPMRTLGDVFRASFSSLH